MSKKGLAKVLSANFVRQTWLDLCNTTRPAASVMGRLHWTRHDLDLLRARRPFLTAANSSGIRVHTVWSIQVLDCGGPSYSSIRFSTLANLSELRSSLPMGTSLRPQSPALSFMMPDRQRERMRLEARPACRGVSPHTVSSMLLL